MGSWFSSNCAVMVVDVDFGATDAESTPALVDLCAQTAELVRRGQEATATLAAYEGSGDLMRQAMSAPSNNELQLQAFEALIPNIANVKGYHECSQAMGRVVPGLLETLNTTATGAPGAGEDGGFAAHLPVVRALADLLEFAYSFDQLKMTKPALQNDFSFYRRMLPRVGGHSRIAVTVSESDAGVISMFIAENVPQTAAFANFVNTTAAQHADALAGFANLCCGMLTRDTAGEWTEYVVRAMVAAIVVYDRCTRVGSFAPASPIRIRRCAQMITRHGGNSVVSLQSFVKYASVHYRDDNVPGNVRIALGD